MSAAVTSRFLRQISKTTAVGYRAISTSAVAAARGKVKGPRKRQVSLIRTLDPPDEAPDLNKFDPIYDDITENSSIIELWKKQKAEELGSSASAASNIDAIVSEEHNIFKPADDFTMTFPKAPPPKGTIDYGEREMFWSEDLLIPYEEFRKLAKKTLIVKRTVQMTRKGKIQSMYAMVVVGNGKGSAGYGEGKSNEASKATMIATRQAIKNMQNFPRYDNRTIYHDIEHKFKATKLQLWARRPGFGCRVSPMIHEVCECVGIQDLAGKIHGSRNPMNVIKALFEALQTQRIPSDLAKARGLRLVDVYHRYYGGIVPTPVSNSFRSGGFRRPPQITSS